jgi:hypothetical protein
LRELGECCQGRHLYVRPVGTAVIHSESAVEYLGHTFDLFHKQLKMTMIIVKVNGDDAAWVIENRYGNNPMTHSIELMHWEPDGTLHVKTYYDIPESVGANDDPYEHILKTNNNKAQIEALEAFKKGS